MQTHTQNIAPSYSSLHSNTSSLPFIAKQIIATIQNNASSIEIFHNPVDKATELLLGRNHNTVLPNENTLTSSFIESSLCRDARAPKHGSLLGSRHDSGSRV